VLLRRAHERYCLPVVVFRCGMIVADTRYRGQVNLPDRFTRLIMTLAATGIAPGSFYPLDDTAGRHRAHYDGLPVNFIAEAIAALTQPVEPGFRTYRISNPYDDGVGLDEYVDWLNDAGYPIRRIDDYEQW
jgi:fatty acid CoA ligase FadD9